MPRPGNNAANAGTLSTRQGLPWLTLVVDQNVFATFHVMLDGGAHFVDGNVFRHDAPRNLSGRIDPFDNTATATTPRLPDRLRHAAAAQVHERLGRRFMRLFQDAFLFRP